MTGLIRYPFAPACCTVKQIGTQADSVTNAMLVEMGVPVANLPPPTVPPSSGAGKGIFEQLTDTVIMVGKWAIVVGAVYYGGGYLYRQYEADKAKKAAKQLHGLRRRS